MPANHSITIVLSPNSILSTMGCIRKKNQGVFVKHYAPGGNQVQNAIFNFKVKVKAIRSLNLVSLERASLVEFECRI